MAICRIGAALVLLASTSASAEILPDAVDLKAAFCVGVLQDYKPVNAVMPNGGPVPAEIQAITDRANKKVQTASDRLLAYLEPRTRYLDADALLAAIAQGKSAGKDTKETIALCNKASPQNADRVCIETARARIKDCYQPDFLPY